MTPIPLTPDQARRHLVHQAGLDRQVLPEGGPGVRALLDALRCIQLDPLDRIGTNADLVALARVDGLRRGDIYRHLLPQHAFEHFAKERCLLPAAAFPAWRDQLAQTPWWRLTDRYKRVPTTVLEAVLAEVRERGPLRARDLVDQGRVEPLDWHGWKGTGRMATMALEILWIRCQVVVCGRAGRDKVYDVPARALPEVADAPGPPQGFAAWALAERIVAAGLLSTAGGPQWSMLSEVRTSGLWEDLLARGELGLYRVTGSRRTYLGPPDLADRSTREPDGRLRILGPLDPLLWDRKLVEQAFGFRYVWEVYKPAAKREWGYYVCPLLHRGALVGRLEAHMEGSRLVVDRLWRESPDFDDGALERALARHEAALA